MLTLKPYTDVSDVTMADLVDKGGTVTIVTVPVLQLGGTDWFGLLYLSRYFLVFDIREKV